jgi:hypothetical protein
MWARRARRTNAVGRRWATAGSQRAEFAAEGFENLRASPQLGPSSRERFPIVVGKLQHREGAQAPLPECSGAGEAERVIVQGIDSEPEYDQALRHRVTAQCETFWQTYPLVG